jgi:hypothetical protein
MFRARLYARVSTNNQQTLPGPPLFPSVYFKDFKNPHRLENNWSGESCFEQCTSRQCCNPTRPIGKRSRPLLPITGLLRLRPHLHRRPFRILIARSSRVSLPRLVTGNL